MHDAEWHFHIFMDFVSDAFDAPKSYQMNRMWISIRLINQNYWSRKQAKQSFRGKMPQPLQNSSVVNRNKIILIFICIKEILLLIFWFWRIYIFNYIFCTSASLLILNPISIDSNMDTPTYPHGFSSSSSNLCDVRIFINNIIIK